MMGLDIVLSISRMRRRGFPQFLVFVFHGDVVGGAADMLFDVGDDIIDIRVCQFEPGHFFVRGGNSAGQWLAQCQIRIASVEVSERWCILCVGSCRC